MSVFDMIEKKHNVFDKIEKAPQNGKGKGEGDSPDFSTMIANIEKPIVDLSDPGGAIKPPPSTAPGWAQAYPEAYNVMVRAKDTVSPSVNMIANNAGSFFSPVGAGMANATELAGERLFDAYMGRIPRLSMTDSLAQTGKDFAWGTALQGASENIGNLADYVPQKIKNIFKRTPAPAALDAEKKASEIGVKLLPSEVAQSKSLAQLESQFGGMFGSGDVMKDADKQNVANLIKEAKGIVDSSGVPVTDEQMGKVIHQRVAKYLSGLEDLKQRRLLGVKNDIVGKLGTSLDPTTLSETAYTAIQAKNLADAKIAKALYQARDALIPTGEMVQLKATFPAAEKLQSMLDRMTPTEIDSTMRARVKDIFKLVDKDELSPILDESGVPFISSKAKIVPSIDYDAIRLLKSNIGADLKRLDPGIEIGMKGVSVAGKSLPVQAYGNLYNTLERDISTYAREAGGGLYEAEMAANKNYGPFKKLAAEVKPLLRRDPSLVLDRMRNVADVRLLKRAMLETDFEQIVKPALTNKIIGELSGFDPQRASQMIDKYSRIIPEIYTSAETDFLTAAISKGNFIANKDIRPLGTKFLNNLITASDPKTISDMAFKSGGSKFARTNLRYIYATADAETKQKISYHLLENILLDGQKIDPATVLSEKPSLVNFDFNKLQKSVKENSNLINAFVKDKALKDRIQRLATIGKYAETTNKFARLGIPETGQTSRFQGHLMSAAVALGSGNVPLALGILIAPGKVAQAYLSPAGRKIATQGLSSVLPSLPQPLKTGAKYSILQAINRGIDTKKELQ